MIYPNEEQTPETVAHHYDSLDKYYRKLWGEHLHHGYWITGRESVQEATEQLIDLVCEEGRIGPGTKVCDVGCGYGATSRYLVKNKRAQVTSLTVSKSQWEYARSHDPESNNPRYLLKDFLHNTFPDNAFDVVISIESSEHMIDKEKFFKEVQRILKPGGRFITCAWLSKIDPKQWEIKHLLEPICREGRLPSMGSEKDYQEMMERHSLTSISYKNLSKQVKKTWSICAFRTTKAVLSDKKLRAFLRDKTATERIFAKTLFRILTAYTTKSMQYGLFRAVK